MTKSFDKNRKPAPDPDVKLSKVSSEGVATLTFTNSMITLPVNDIQNATFRNESSKQAFPAILVTVIPGPYSSISDLRFNYTLTSYTERNLEFELHFE